MAALVCQSVLDFGCIRAFESVRCDGKDERNDRDVFTTGVVKNLLLSCRNNFSRYTTNSTKMVPWGLVSREKELGKKNYIAR